MGLKIIQSCILIASPYLKCCTFVGHVQGTVLLFPPASPPFYLLPVSSPLLLLLSSSPSASLSLPFLQSTFLPPPRDTTSLIPVLTMFSGATQLVEVYESTPGVVKMPRMLQLVKQLKKELDIKKIISQCKHSKFHTCFIDCTCVTMVSF